MATENFIFDWERQFLMGGVIECMHFEMFPEQNVCSNWCIRCNLQSGRIQGVCSEDKYKQVMIERGNLSGNKEWIFIHAIKQIMMEIDDGEKDEATEKAKKDATKKARLNCRAVIEANDIEAHVLMLVSLLQFYHPIIDVR